ncbi:5'/3'-nucleotidase SurE [Pontiella sulfatireligans]|uniref:5'-nucleotidase SurE n=1 Tax=Pontiella sulfatireligans TaxID=2750658 RepID=A0A6C2US51_9BACT|nr:5'/3'-nucleotidase SurE [Pontiella sulfatireligans]VGO23088.1 5'/3'-nucleotidase SurE [Pontiella sulfatireligans]
MKILLCNDDGIHARGIAELHSSIGHIGDLHVCAPDTERSAAGHAITLTDPIKTFSVEKNDQLFGTAVGGTPADCIKLALCLLHKDNPPDLVVSGINLGSNTGISVLYSGTVSAASEAVILGVPAIALSLCTYQNPHWETAAKVASEIVARVAENPLPDGTLLNVNIPNVPLSELKGMKAARMGRSRFVEKFTTHLDPRGNNYYWLDGELDLLDDSADTDVRVVESGYVALTPIQIEMTAYKDMAQVATWNVKY